MPYFGLPEDLQRVVTGSVDARILEASVKTQVVRGSLYRRGCSHRADIGMIQFWMKAYGSGVDTD